MNLTTYFNIANQKYKRISESRKKIISLSIFILLFLLFSDILFFNSFNFYKVQQSQNLEITAKIERLNKQLRIVNPSQSVIEETQLKARKLELEKNIMDLKNNGITQTLPEDVPKLINNILVKFSNLTLVKLSNESNSETLNNIQKHSFNIEFNSSSYMNAFKFIKEIEKMTQIESITFKIQNEKLNINVKFFILNESNSLFKRTK